VDESLLAGREAVDRLAWNEAREAFSEADHDQILAPGDLLLFADASWWTGYPDEAVDALQRAHTAYADAGDTMAAAGVAVRLAYLSFRRMTFAVAAGWMTKAEHMLEDKPESGVHAWVQLLHIADAFFARGDLDDAIARADEAIEISLRHGVPEVHSLAMSLKGYSLLRKGDWREGMALIDEATAAAVSGELDLRAACDVYCNTIAACRDLSDYRRAGEWTEEAYRWMHRHSAGGYPGICRVHRAELKRLRGSYSEAEREARVAVEELERYQLLDSVGFAHYQVGEVRLHMGDLDAAEQAFMRAYEYGWASQPGLAVLTLARGDAKGAAKAIAASLAGGAGVDGGGPALNVLGRARLLPAQVTIALAAGDTETASDAAEELEQVAIKYDRTAFEAATLNARGEIELHDGRFAEAAVALDKAWRLWREIDLPYESARARLLLGRAKAAAGDETTARMELGAARSTFERLGAVLDVRKVDELLGDDAPRPAGDGRRVSKTFRFTDIVTSTDLVGLIGDDAWEDVLRWHNRALRSTFAKHRGQEVRHTGDGFFVAFDDASDAVEAAVAIQRRLAAQRHEHGFAPWIRIGLHTAEATPQGSDYSGQGVHVAARVGDVGEREQIVISADTRNEAGAIRFPVSEPRSVTLKGIDEPVDVHTIDWQ
jgi:class 3 adenylate cyclase